VVRLSVFALFGSRAAVPAADATQADDMATYEAATVSTIVTSQVALRPSRWRIRVRPSGCLPSELASQRGSFNGRDAGFVTVHRTKSLMYVG
jgi:hypothetical protein